MKHAPDGETCASSGEAKCVRLHVRLEENYARSVARRAPFEERELVENLEMERVVEGPVSRVAVELGSGALEPEHEIERESEGGSGPVEARFGSEVVAPAKQGDIQEPLG